MTNPDLPIPDSYWVIPGKLLAGEYPGAAYNPGLSQRRMDSFLAAGFDTFIDLTKLNELVPYEPLLQESARNYDLEVIHNRFAIGDFGVPTPENMTAILDAIDAALAEGRKVYIHCWGGIGRTGTAVGCYLVRHGLTGEQALDQLARWWQTVPKQIYHPRSPETQRQVQFILDWEQHNPGASMR